ncbi:MAG: acyl transferase [Saprospiraceae bacterium]
MSYEQQRELIFQKVRNIVPESFEALALEVFRFQAVHNPVYARYLSLLKIDFQKVGSAGSIPFLPIQLFKNHSVKTGDWEEETTFTSSGTTGAAASRHPVRDVSFYLKNAVAGFRHFYGDPAGYCILALLPSYLERTGSSLVCMAEHFIQHSSYPQSGFFLKNTDELLQVLAASRPKKALLLGVSFALLDLAERHQPDFRGVVVMETGGMKGRRRELTRHELHGILKKAFNVSAIHSEYGMTELFSQAYSKGEGRFLPAPTMRVFSREITDPLTAQQPGKTGVLNIIDLANFDSCSFIATDDLGRVFSDGSFEVLGRLDNSDIRGCNLMV